MAETVTIPRIDKDQPGPGWIAITWGDPPKATKPLIKCQCGKITGIGLHHVHADCRVIQSFFHSKEMSFVHNGKTYTHEPGCDWHVYLILKDYDQGDFPPRAD